MARRELAARCRVFVELDVELHATGKDGAAQVDVQVPRLPRGLHTLARGRRVERLVGKVEVDRSPPAARARARDDLDPRSLAAAVGPERSRIDDDPGNSDRWLLRWQGLMHERAKRHSLVEHPPKNAKRHSPSVGARIAPDPAGQRVLPPADGLRLGQDIDARGSGRVCDSGNRSGTDGCRPDGRLQRRLETGDGRQQAVETGEVESWPRLPGCVLNNARS